MTDEGLDTEHNIVLTADELNERSQWWEEAANAEHRIAKAVEAERDRYREALLEIRERWAYPKLVALINSALGEPASDEEER